MDIKVGDIVQHCSPDSTYIGSISRVVSVDEKYVSIQLLKAGRNGDMTWNNGTSVGRFYHFEFDPTHIRKRFINLEETEKGTFNPVLWKIKNLDEQFKNKTLKHRIIQKLALP